MSTIKVLEGQTLRIRMPENLLPDTLEADIASILEIIEDNEVELAIIDMQQTKVIVRESFEIIQKLEAIIRLMSIKVRIQGLKGNLAIPLTDIYHRSGMTLDLGGLENKKIVLDPTIQKFADQIKSKNKKDKQLRELLLNQKNKKIGKSEKRILSFYAEQRKKKSGNSNVTDLIKRSIGETTVSSEISDSEEITPKNESGNSRVIDLIKRSFEETKELPGSLERDEIKSKKKKYSNEVDI